MKVIVSFTTSPTRISKTEIMVNSILNQTKKPDYFLLNIPKIFPRTGETYKIPDFISNNEDIIVNVVDTDYGPATKVIPTLQFIKDNNIDIDNVRIIYLDDDIKYPSEMINAFLKYSQRENVILTSSGFTLNHVVTDQRVTKIISCRKHLQFTHIVEGYGAVCLSPKVFKDDFLEYFNKYSSIKYCLLSDDIILSNYYAKHNNRCFIISLPYFNINDMWSNGSILEYGNSLDALHVSESSENCNIKKYRKVFNLLGKNRELYIKFNLLKNKKAIMLRFSRGMERYS